MLPFLGVGNVGTFLRVKDFDKFVNDICFSFHSYKAAFSLLLPLFGVFLAYGSCGVTKQFGVISNSPRNFLFYARFKIGAC